MATHKITVVKRVSDYMAYLDGNKALWGCGKSPNEAVASVVYSHQRETGIEITEKFERLQQRWRRTRSGGRLTGQAQRERETS